MKCYVFNCFSTVSHYRVSPSRQTVDILDTTMFTCISNKQIKWKFGQDSLPPNAIEITKVNSLKRTLLIVDTVLDNKGYYSCHAEDEEYIVFEGMSGYLDVRGKHLREMTDK